MASRQLLKAHGIAAGIGRRIVHGKHGLGPEDLVDGVHIAVLLQELTADEDRRNAEDLGVEGFVQTVDAQGDAGLVHAVAGELTGLGDEHEVGAVVPQDL